jgi:hypothetical protein
MRDRALSRPDAIGTPGPASVSDEATVATEAGDWLVDEAAAAAILGLPPRTLQWWRLKRTGPPFVRMSPRVIRYRRADLARWVTARLQGTPALGASDFGKSDGPPDEAA